MSLVNDDKYNSLVGIDYDVSALKKKFKRTSIEWLNNWNGMDKTFDVITAFHVLEHIVDLESFVVSLKKLMHENSTLIFEVPNKAKYGESAQGLLYGSQSKNTLIILPPPVYSSCSHAKGLRSQLVLVRWRRAKLLLSCSVGGCTGKQNITG